MQSDTLTFSIVMPVYLGAYKGAAKDRERKFVRSILSVLNQTYPSWELIIISDGCQKSIDIIMENEFLEDPRIKAYKINRGDLWDGLPRNAGILKSTKDYILYLDADDEYRSNYLRNLADEMFQNEADWYYVDDFIYAKGGYEVRKAEINKLGHCGTSNVIHSRSLNVSWPKKGNYAHDFFFINTLKAASKNYKRLDTVGYVVQHIPNRYDL